MRSGIQDVVGQAFKNPWIDRERVQKKIWFLTASTIVRQVAH